MKYVNRANCIADRKYIKENCKLNCKECEFLYEVQTECDGFSRLVKIVVYSVVVGIVLFFCLAKNMFYNI